VLIEGETGTGKELIAEAIHNCSTRSTGRFVKVNCAAIPAGLLENELFGHERGAYTGAAARGIGRFEWANRGTLFLDEIGDLPIELQPKLLAVSQERQFERLGGTTTIHTDVRLICATNRNLREMVEERTFRADLFYRLSVFPIELPPLRDRPEDIRPLVQHFAMGYAHRMRKPITAISYDFLSVAERYYWPGNVRELENFIERSVILSTGGVLTCSLCELNEAPHSSAHLTLEEAERSHILQALLRTQGVVGGPNGAAVRLGLPRTTLLSKMRRLGISPCQSSSAPGGMKDAGAMSSRRFRAEVHNSGRPICENDREEPESDRATQAVAALPRPERRRDHEPSRAEFIHAVAAASSSLRSSRPVD
jgi:formate hydrogenlyase transcriptional activator